MCVVAAVSPAFGFQCGPLPGVVLAGCGAVAVLVGFSLPDLWMISPAEHECSGQRGRRSGCVPPGNNGDVTEYFVLRVDIIRIK